MKRLITLLTLIILCTTASFAVTIYDITMKSASVHQDFDGTRGKSFMVDLYVDNDMTLTGLQFALTLPTGISLRDGITTDRTAGLLFAKGVNNMLLSFDTSTVIQGNSGKVLTLVFDINADLPSNIYKIKFTNIGASSADKYRHAPDFSVSVYVRNLQQPKIGDANLDFKVNANDIPVLQNMLLHPELLQPEADVNRDGNYTITDLTRLVANLRKP